MERARNRDPALEQDLWELFRKDQKDSSVAQLMVDPSNFKDTAIVETKPMREYIIKESLQQYKDYYESDSEEQRFFEYFENMTNRDKIRFGELFTDYTIDNNDYKNYAMIAKREYNPELSVFSNFALDLVDFKDRVRPMARDLALFDATQRYQK